MKQILISLAIIFSTSPLFAQHRVTLILDLPDKMTDKNFEYFMTSEFNEWKPNDTAYKFQDRNGSLTLTFNYDKNYFLQYKITRGNWESCESDNEGFGIENRIAEIKSDTTIFVKIDGWKDLIKRKHTVTDTSRLKVDSVFSQSLNAMQKIWIYLPQQYSIKNTKKKFPVVYMPDGETLFDRYYTENGQEWQVDETIDSLNNIGKGNFIIVGISSTPNRLAEYSPYPLQLFKDVQGEKYADFLTNELIPFINKKYRTLKEAEHTSVAGSSLGALISLYILIEKNNFFRSAGILSIAQGWNAPDNKFIIDEIIRKTPKSERDAFIYYGQMETQSLPAFSKEIESSFRKNKRNKTYIMYDPNGKHEAKSWVNPFASFLLFLEQKN